MTRCPIAAINETIANELVSQLHIKQRPPFLQSIQDGHGFVRFRGKSVTIPAREIFWIAGPEFG